MEEAWEVVGATLVVFNDVEFEALAVTDGTALDALVVFFNELEVEVARVFTEIPKLEVTSVLPAGAALGVRVLHGLSAARVTARRAREETIGLKCMLLTNYLVAPTRGSCLINRISICLQYTNQYQLFVARIYLAYV